MPRSREVQDLLDRFIALEGASQIYGVLSNRGRIDVLGDLRKDENHPYHSVIAGEIFELFAYDYQKSALPAGRRLLTPRTTLQFYSVASKVPIRETRDGNGKAIRGISTPDGIELEELGLLRMIQRLHEYKISQDINSIMKQMNNLLDIPLLRNNLRITNPEGQNKRGNVLAGLIQGEKCPIIVPSDFELRYTAPQNSTLRQMGLPRRVSADYLPIHTETFRELVRVIVAESAAQNLPVPSSSRVLS